ncbi:MAG TPA: hypothetical protein VKN76_03865 [Kiloniellaceae bacterium]|nr:hypothetical protein [Kiloniellaceae bacterium]
MEKLLKDQMLEAGGLAALTICESLLVALSEKGILDDDEATLILEDAMNSHQTAIGEGRAVLLHQAAARLIRLIMVNANSVRGSSKLGSPDPESRYNIDSE